MILYMLFGSWLTIISVSSFDDDIMQITRSWRDDIWLPTGMKTASLFILFSLVFPIVAAHFIVREIASRIFVDKTKDKLNNVKED